MRILIVGAGGYHRTEASLARAAESLGHTAKVIDALGWRRRIGPVAPRLVRHLAGGFGPDFILCTRHAIAAGVETIQDLVARTASAFWYFDAAAPLPEPVVTLAQLTARTFTTYGYQVDAFIKGGAPSAHFLPQGMDPEVDYPAERIPVSFTCDTSFVGSGQYPRRHAVLQAIAAVCRLQVRGPGWENAAAGLPIAGGRLKGQAFTYAVGGAAISVGIDALPVQREETQGGTSNRLWKVLGAGGLFLGEYVTGVERFARHGEHAVWYKGEGDAAEQVKRLLADAELRKRIALAGRVHALAHHTYRHRLELLLAGQGYTST